MKKAVLCLSVLALTVSCRKVQEGGNKRTLRGGEGTEYYSDDTHRTVVASVKDTTSEGTEAHNAKDTTRVMVETAAAPSNGSEHTVNTMSAPVNNAKSETK